jgi:cell division transport system permease protein
VRALRYSFQEAAASLRRGGRTGLMSIVTITAALFVLGALLLISVNVQRLVGRWSASAEMSVFLRDDIPPGDREAVEKLIAGSPLVTGREFISKAEALRRFKRDFVELAGLVSPSDNNPLPASFEVRVRTMRGREDELDDFASRLAATTGVSDVRYDRQWIDRLTAGVSVLRGFGIVVAAVLAFAGAVTVANVVRLACHTRRHELEIMHLVGAPLSFVRGPFVAEGFLQGGLGALVAIALLWAGFAAGRLSSPRWLPLGVRLDGIEFLSPQLCAFVLAGGMAVGCLGGLIASYAARTD